MAHEWIKQANSLELVKVASALGLSVRHGDLAACPICGMTKRGAGRVFHRGDSGFFCFYCDEGGDNVDLASLVLCGQRLGKSPERNKTVQEWFAYSFASIEHADIREDDSIPERSYPPENEVLAFAERLGPVSLSKSIHVHGWLRKRGYTPSMIPAACLCKPAPAPRWWPWQWEADYPVILQAFDFLGRLRAFHGVSVERERAQRKTTWPRGFSSGGLVFLDPAIAKPIVIGERKEPARIVINEGATDFLTACQEASKMKEPPGVVGITSGSESALSAIAWPKGTTFFMAMDPDEAGDRYEKKIRSALTPFPLRRLRSNHGSR